MLSNEYKVYVKNNINLARSICVKSQQTIEGITQYLQDIGITITYVNPNTHKYYVNLQGEYWNVGLLDPELSNTPYVNVNDQMMYFTSIDDESIQELTKANLVNHPISHRELRQFSVYFNNLVIQWPKQEQLIRRIIDPIPNTSSEIEEMEDGTILWYDSRLVEENEKNLISSLQQWIYNYLARWNIIAYQNSDELYAAAWIGIFYLNIVNAIIGIRLENIKTNEVHSFHLWNYLGSYFYLDRFQSAITKDQALYLYRNMEYILNNKGNKANLQLLYENIIKDYGMQLNVFEIRQHSDTLLETLQYTNKLNKYPIDSKNIIEYSNGISSVDRLIRQMNESAVLNPSLMNDNIDNIKESILHSSSNQIDTGIIECERRINVTEGLVNIIEEKMRYWFFFALTDRFNYRFVIPIAEEKNITISAKEAVYLLLYCSIRYGEYYSHTTTNSQYNTSSTPLPLSTTIPDICVSNLLNYDATLSIPDNLTNSLTDSILNNLDTLHNDLYGAFELFTISDLDDLVTRVMNQRIKHEVIKNYYSNPFEQMDANEQIQKKLYRHYVLDDGEVGSHPLYLRAIATNIIGYNEWSNFLSDIQFNIESLNIKDYELIINSILKEFIGDVKVNEGMISPYFEMMEILKLLSSYTVTFIPSEASSYPKQLNIDKHSFKLLNFTMNFKFNVDDSVPMFSINHLEITDSLNNTTVEPNRTVYPQLHIS